MTSLILNIMLFKPEFSFFTLTILFFATEFQLLFLSAYSSKNLDIAKGRPKKERQYACRDNELQY